MTNSIRTENLRLSARCSDLVAELERKRRSLKGIQLAEQREADAEACLPEEEARRSRLTSAVSRLRKTRDEKVAELETLRPRVGTLERVRAILEG